MDAESTTPQMEDVEFPLESNRAYAGAVAEFTYSR
jgi:hypothetical protein